MEENLNNTLIKLPEIPVKQELVSNHYGFIINDQMQYQQNIVLNTNQSSILYLNKHNIFNKSSIQSLNDMQLINSYHVYAIPCIPNTLYYIKFFIKDQELFNNILSLNSSNSAERQITGISAYTNYNSLSTALLNYNINIDNQILYKSFKSTNTGFLYFIHNSYTNREQTLSNFLQAVDIVISTQEIGDEFIEYDTNIINFSNTYIINNINDYTSVLCLPDNKDITTDLPECTYRWYINNLDKDTLLADSVENEINLDIISSKIPYIINNSVGFNFIASNECSTFNTNEDRWVDGTTYAKNNAYFIVSGNAGDNYVTITGEGSATINDIKDYANYFGAVIAYDDNTYKLHNAKYRDDNTIQIFPLLYKNVTNVKLGNYKTGIHLSKMGYIAYTQHMYSQTIKHCEKSYYLSRFYPTEADNYSTVNPFTSLFGGRIHTMINFRNINTDMVKCPSRTYFEASFPWNTVTNHEASGILWEQKLYKLNGYLELCIGGINTHDEYIEEGYEIHIEFYLDDELKYEYIKNTSNAELLYIDYNNAEYGKLKIYCNDWEMNKTGFAISYSYWWINSKDWQDEKVFSNFITVAQMFDSWGEFQDYAVATEMQRLIEQSSGCYVPYYNHSKGSQTSAWGKGWVYENVIKYHPSHMFINFIINDQNSNQTTGWVETITGSNGREYNNIVPLETYVQNMKDLCDIAFANNIQPIIAGGNLIANIVWYHALINHLSVCILK